MEVNHRTICKICGGSYTKGNRRHHVKANKHVKQLELTRLIKRYQNLISLDEVNTLSGRNHKQKDII